METVLLFIIIGLIVIGIILSLVRKTENYKEDFINIRNQLTTNEQIIQRMESAEKDEFRQNRKEISDQLKVNRDEMANSLKDFRGDLLQSLKSFQESFDKNVKSFNDLQKEKFGQMETK